MKFSSYSTVWGLSSKSVGELLNDSKLSRPLSTSKYIGFAFTSKKFIFILFIFSVTSLFSLSKFSPSSSTPLPVFSVSQSCKKKKGEENICTVLSDNIVDCPVDLSPFPGVDTSDELFEVEGVLRGLISENIMEPLSDYLLFVKHDRVWSFKVIGERGDECCDV